MGGGGGMRTRAQSRCEIGALQDVAEVAASCTYPPRSAQWVDDLAQRTQAPPSECGQQGG